MNGNIAQLFTPHRQHPDRVLYRHFAGEAWRDVTVAEIEQEIARWQAAFRRDGFAAGDRVAICARNGVAWVAMDLAALGMRLVVVPLYVDDNPDNVAWCVAHAEARLLIVENSRLAASLARVTGTMTVGKDHIKLEASLGWLLTPLKPKIEDEIVAQLDKVAGKRRA